MERMKKILLACVLVLFLVGVSVLTMADVANATEMSAYEHDMKLAPLGTAKEEFVVVAPGGNLAKQCESFCLDKETCAAIYYESYAENKCYFYMNYGFSLVSATGYNTTFKIWTK